MSGAYLLLEDGDALRRRARRRARARPPARSCSTPRMSGYQESVTDPSYRGQIIVFTYPHIGNYGVAAAHMESDARPRARGDHARGRSTARTRPAPRAAGSPGWPTAASRPSAASTPARWCATSATGARCAAACSPPRRPEAEAHGARARRAADGRPGPGARGHAGRAGHPRRGQPGPARGGASTPASRTRSCATCASAARASSCTRATPPPRSCSRATPTRSSWPTAPATPPRWTTWSTACAAWWARCRCGASASATSCCAGRSAWRPSSCPSATAAPTTRSRTWRPGKIEITSQNHGFAVLGPRRRADLDTDEPLRWETDFGAAELQQLNLYDRTVEGLVLRDVPGLDGPVPPRGRPRPARRAAPVRPLPARAGRCLGATTSRRSWCSARGRS